MITKLKNLYIVFTIEDIQNPVTLETIQRKTEQIDNPEVICKDCEYNLHYEDYREEVEGETLCEDCIIKAEALESSDWDTREGARGYPYGV